MKALPIGIHKKETQDNLYKTENGRLLTDKYWQLIWNET